EVEDSGAVHIFTDANGGPRYLYRAAGTATWTSEVVDDVPPLGRYATMDIDDSGGIHLAYQRSYTTTLHYAYRAPGSASWTISQVASGGEHARIAVAPSGMVHIVHVVSSTIEHQYFCPAL
ncbi:MAG: hypothetical protein AAGC55_27315, partial [Myxococcota bacterium]